MANETAQNPGVLHSSAVSLVPELLVECQDEFNKALLIGGEFELPETVLKEKVYGGKGKPQFVTFKVPYSESEPSYKAPKETGDVSGLGYKSAVYYDDKYQHGKEFTIEDLNDVPEDIPADMTAYLIDWYNYHKFDVTIKSILEGSASSKAGPHLTLTAPNGINLFSNSTSVFHVGKATSDPGGGYKGNIAAQYAGNMYTGPYAVSNAGLRQLLKEFYKGCIQERLPDGRPVFGPGETSQPKIVILSPDDYMDQWFELLSENQISWDTKAAGNVAVSNELPKKFQVEVHHAPYLASGYCYAFLASRGPNRRAPLYLHHRKMDYGNTDMTVKRPNGNESTMRLYVPSVNSESVMMQEAWKILMWWNPEGNAGESHGCGKMTMA